MIQLKNGFQGEQMLVIPRIIVKSMESDPIMQKLHITDIGYFPQATHHRRERTEPINQFVLIYCVNGSGWYRINSHIHNVTANQYFILPAEVPHAYGANSASPWTIYWIHFKGEMAALYAKGALQPISISPDRDSRISERLALFEEMLATLRNGYDNDSLRYVSSVLHYFLGSLRYLRQYRNAGTAMQTPDTVEKAIHYMKENMEKQISLDDLAGYAGFSISHFSALFKQKTGHSPLAYNNLLKVQHACHLLDCSDLKINQISYKVGIKDTFYFSRMFSKIMGMSPKEYRESKKG